MQSQGEVVERPRTPIHRAASARALAALLAFLGLTRLDASCLAQHGQHGRAGGGGMEEFEEVDPYTKGDPALNEALGYVHVGVFPWVGTDRTPDVQLQLGAAPMLFVETRHFKLASSLGTYELPNDKLERERIKAELKQLEGKLKRPRFPKGELDPWLRLHLYAQRLETLYESFVADLGLELADFEKAGPHLGHGKKHMVLLTQRKSEFGRYLKAYLAAEGEYSFRWGDPEGMFFGSNIESLREGWTDPDAQPFDAMLHDKLIQGVVANFVDGFNSNYFDAPPWLAMALGHVYRRRVDPRWVSFAGSEIVEEPREKDWQWEERVKGLVKKDFYASMEAIFSWPRDHKWNPRDHMIMWSKVDYMLRERPQELRPWFTSVARSSDLIDEAERLQERIARQTTALEESFGQTPDEFDEAWARWVKRHYRKR